VWPACRGYLQEQRRRHQSRKKNEPPIAGGSKVNREASNEIQQYWMTPI
jgi:hypothetical protein